MRRGEGALVLTRTGVRGVVNTCDEYAGPAQTYRRMGMQQLYIPVVDYTSPTVAQIEQAVRFIEEFAARGEKVYVHCKGTPVRVCSATSPRLRY